MNHYYNNINSVNIATWEIINNIDTLISGIHKDVENSELNNKNLNHCRWDEDIKRLEICFNSSLSSSEISILDNIVNNNSE